VRLAAKTPVSFSSVGYRLRHAADLIHTGQVFARTITLVVMMAALEMGTLRPL
jgi:NitT/TauT family transport system permease protein